MTNLDQFMAILKPSCSPITAVQITPRYFLLVVNEKDFSNCLQSFNRNDIRFRFLEERKSGLDIHLSISIKQNTLEVTFRVIKYSSGFIQELREIFPPAEVFIQEIERSNQYFGS